LIRGDPEGVLVEVELVVVQVLLVEVVEDDEFV